MAQSKIFRDIVHGYITVDEPIVSKIIDHPQFQRLKRIKQTNIDVLFPTANQTRFEHSLGVYHLGKRLFDSILAKCSRSHRKELQRYRLTLELACLLHDIGHAPLSHVGESFYDTVNIKNELDAFEQIRVKTSIAPHELMSVLVALKIFGHELEQFDVDIDLFFRLITGAKLDTEGVDGCALTPLRKALIPLLSSPFDADKMDYLMRDSVSAGITSIELDLDRIVTSACLVKHAEHGLLIAFGKSGFSVGTSLVNNRNYMYKWIYGHHKVQYQYQILTRYIKRLCEHDLKKAFSFDAITGGNVEFQGLRLSYTDDYDLWHIFKTVSIDDPQIPLLKDQLFNRNHYKAFWKTKIEFDQAKAPFIQKLKYIQTRLLADPDQFLINELINGTDLQTQDILLFISDPKIVMPAIDENMFFYLKDHNNKSSVKTYQELFRDELKADDKSNIDNFMFHIFMNRDKFSTTNYNAVIQALSSL